jgi:hypothetical protein
MRTLAMCGWVKFVPRIDHEAKPTTRRASRSRNATRQTVSLRRSFRLSISASASWAILSIHSSL